MSILSQSDEEEIRLAARRLNVGGSPDDVRQSEIVLGAFRVLKLVMGKAWCDKHIKPLPGESRGFLKRAMATSADSLKYIDRIIHLAEYINQLQGFPNFDKKLIDLRKGGLEEIFYELCVASSFLDIDRLVGFVAPSGLKGADYDLVAKLDGKIIHVEIKCITDEPVYVISKIRNPLKKAAKQLPADGPGVVFLMLNSDWIKHPNFRRDVESVAESFLRNNTRVNAIFLNWEIWSSQRPFIRALMFHCISNNSPKISIDSISNLIVRCELPPVGTKLYVDVTYI